MSFVVVIPARYAASRLPGKPLAEIQGRPMLAHVWERACRAGASEVVVATDDVRVAEAARGFGASVEMTAASHASGTDRIQEVARRRGWSAEQVVVNVQGDEPLLPPELIEQVATLLVVDVEAGMATLAETIDTVAEVFDPDSVKVVTDDRGRALYFSRAPVPWHRGAFGEGAFGEAAPAALPAQGVWRRHLGIYAYRSGLLHDFVVWQPAPLERIEKLEQLRVLHHGGVIRVADACRRAPGGVDTIQDLERVRAVIARDGAS